MHVAETLCLIIRYAAVLYYLILLLGNVSYWKYQSFYNECLQLNLSH